MHGMCNSRNWQHHSLQDWQREPRDAAPVAVKERDRDERVGDADRERAAAVLSKAFRDGVLRVEEFDQRLSSAYAAATVGDLDDAMRDLPRDWSDELRSAERANRRAELYRRGWRASFATYRSVMLLLLGIWFLTALDDLAPGGDALPYFWPIWPMLGWGIPLFFSRPRRRTTMRPWDYRSASSRI